MPLPLFLGIGAAIAGAVGVGSGVHGAVKMKEANDTMKAAENRHKGNVERFEKENKLTSTDMDKLGKLELEILNSFQTFSDVFERIKNKPQFDKYSKDGISLPKYDREEIRKASVGAGVLLGGLGGAALGTAGGFAAAGAVSAAGMALGTASTGTAIASLSGAALTNATLAALGGGAIAAGGGGMALGSTILGATTLGVGLLVGGVIFNITGGKLSEKADEAWAQMKKAEQEIDKICKYLYDLRNTSNKYYESLSSVNTVYKKRLDALVYVVKTLNHNDWNLFSNYERELTENTVLLVGLLYDMCKVKLVLKSSDKNSMNTINTREIDHNISRATYVVMQTS